MATDWSQFESVGSSGTATATSPDWSQFEALPPAEPLQPGGENAEDASAGDLLKSALSWAGSVARGDDTPPEPIEDTYGTTKPLNAPELPAPAPQTESLESEVVQPVLKGAGKVVSAIGNIPAEVYNTGWAMTKAYPPMDLPFQPGKTPLPKKLLDAAQGAAQDEFGPGPPGPMGEAAGNIVRNTLESATTPESLAQIPLLEFTPGRAAMLALQASQTPAQIKQTVDTLKDPNASRAEKWTALGNTGISLAMSAGLALSLKPGEVTAKYTPEEAAKAAEPAPPQPPKPNETELNPESRNNQTEQNQQSREQGTAAEQKGAAENAQGPLALNAPPPTPEELNASQIQEATEVHGDVRPQSGQRQEQVPAEESGGGIQQPAVSNAEAPQSEVALKPALDVAEHPLDKPFKKGFTGDALKFGANLDPAHPEVLARLKELEDKARVELHNIPQDLDHFQQLSVAGAKKQWLTEAIQAAEGLEERDVARELVGPDYKAPFPKKELVAKSAKGSDALPGEADRGIAKPVTNKAAETLAKPANFDPMVAPKELVQRYGKKVGKQQPWAPGEAQAALPAIQKIAGDAGYDVEHVGSTRDPAQGSEKDMDIVVKPKDRHDIGRVVSAFAQHAQSWWKDDDDLFSFMLPSGKKLEVFIAGIKDDLENDNADYQDWATDLNNNGLARKGGAKPLLTSQSTKPVLTSANVETTADIPAAQKSEPVAPGEKFDTKAAREQKKFLLDAVDQAIAEAPEEVPRNVHDEALDRVDTSKDRGELFTKYNVSPDKSLDTLKGEIQKNSYVLKPKVTIQVPGDGEFEVINSKKTLMDFKERAKKFPTTAPRAPSASTPRSTPSKPAPLGKVNSESTLKALRDIVSDDPTRDAISGIWSDGKQTVATNGRILTNINHGLGGTTAEPKVFTTEGKPYVKQKPEERDYPNWKQIVPKDFKLSVKNLDTEKLFNVLKQAQQATSDRSNAVKVYANKDGTLGFSSGDPEIASYATNIDPDASPIFAADPNYMIAALNAARAVGDGKVQLDWNSELEAFRIKSKNAYSIIMPIRLEGSQGLKGEAIKAAQASKATPASEPTIPKGPGIIGMGGAVPGEVSTPTIEDQINGELAPPRPPPVPLETPAQPSTISSIREAFNGAFDRARGNVDAMLNRTFPQTTRIDPRLGELGARWISSPIAARLQAEVFAADVIGNSGVDPVKLGAALTEDNLHSIKNAFEEKADEAENREEIVSDLQGQLENLADADTDNPAIKKEIAQTKREISRISKLTDEDAAKFRTQAGKVKSFIGAENFPFKTEDEYDDFLNDPTTKEVLERHRSLWNAVIDPQYKSAMQIDPNFELPSRGLQTGARINLRAVQDDEPPLKNTVGTVRRGNLLGTLRRKSPFGVQAKGTGEAYALNYYDIIENTFNKQLETANRNAFDQALVKKGQAVIAPPGETVNIAGKKAVAFPLRRQRLVFSEGGGANQNQSIYINARLAPEYRIGANVDEVPPPILRALGKVLTPALNRAALAGLTDATTHSINLMTALGTLPGGSGKLLQDSILSAVPGRPDAFIAIGRALAKGFGDNRAQEAALAEIGAMKPGQYQTTRSPGTWLHSGSDVIRWLDKSVRLALDDSYKRLAQQGIVENSETARREFVNQVGQYNKRAQTYYKRFFRDTGLGPFVTAGTTFNNLGVRAALGPLVGPGVRASSVPSALALRANMAAKLAGTVGTIALLNYILTHKKGGGVMGRAGVRLGAIDTGQNDKQGRPLQLDLLSMTGPGRGLRVIGARGFGEAKLNGLPTGTALDAASRDILNSALAPFTGPVVRAASVAATGFPPAKDVGRVSPVVPPGHNQTAANLKQALLDANPVVSGLVKSAQPGSTGITEELKTQLPRLVPQPGKQPAMMKDYPAIVRRAQANAYIEDVIGRARKMAPADRVPFLIEATKRLESPQDQRKAIREFKYRKVAQ